ncbi:MAG: fructosamine kinase family protein [Ferruginibacter sp.]
MKLQNILDDCGLKVTSVERLHGGDISESYCLYGVDTKYFLKVNDARVYPDMFEKEASGLNALRSKIDITIPAVIRYGKTDRQQYLLLEWLEKGSPANDCWEKFGSGLATLHQQGQPYFGWPEDNYIGSLHQLNTVHQSWHSFYAECRVMPLVKQLFNKNHFSKQDTIAAENLCKKLDQLFPVEPPSLLHGDLWSGNFMITSNGHAAIYDPAVYFGNREMDIGMTRLFGGFNQRFYIAYQQQYPLESGWQQRLALTQLYPLLVHAVLFGEHYVNSAKEIILRFA